MVGFGRRPADADRVNATLLVKIILSGGLFYLLS
jgi:hypothetical protein